MSFDRMFFGCSRLKLSVSNNPKSSFRMMHFPEKIYGQSGKKNRVPKLKNKNWNFFMFLEKQILTFSWSVPKSRPTRFRPVIPRSCTGLKYAGTSSIFVALYWFCKILHRNKKLTLKQNGPYGFVHFDAGQNCFSPYVFTDEMYWKACGPNPFRCVPNVAKKMRPI